MVFNYLHVCHDSRYKSSIDNGPIYSIIDPTNAQMGKSNAGYPLFRELPDDARQQAARRGILPEQPAEGPEGKKQEPIEEANRNETEA